MARDGGITHGQHSPQWVPLQVGIAAARRLWSPCRGCSAPGGEEGCSAGCSRGECIAKDRMKGIVRDRAGANPLRASWWAQCCHKQRDGSKACCVCCWEWDGSKALWWVQSHHKQCKAAKALHASWCGCRCTMQRDGCSGMDAPRWVQTRKQWGGCKLIARAVVGANRSQAMGGMQNHCMLNGRCKCTTSSGTTETGWM